MSVKVGVRVRPFNQRQKDLNCKLCVDMIGPMTRLFDAQDTEKHRDFTFDYSFWSHDQFTTDQNGFFVGDSDKYADQRHVFEQVGLEILSNAWEGYHCCLFAYGQTGAGKSYSMVGYGPNKGIVPISCQEIFTRIAANDNKNKEYQVNVSMLEIYNERVQDLLIPINKRTKQGLKIRQHKTLGVYVEGLSKHYVDNYIAIENKMEEGSRNRSVAATQMNASSSRAHTIISIQFRQIDIVENRKKQKLSVIYLVDLAGSQKVGKTGATGDRLKQAAGINKSLSVLGLVISTLAQKSTGKGKNIVVPYRDSCLTRILQNALGGNSKTLMICAISPANDNYQQTLSTLRYADQAKKIQNKAVVNQSQTDKIIRTLTAQKDQLRQKVQKFQQMFKKLGLGMGLNQQMLQQFNDAKQQLRFNTMMMNDYQMTKSQKLKIQQQQQTTDINKVDITKPHLSNLNQDPQLSRKINYSIDTQITKIGRRNVQPLNNIQIGGMGIRTLHAVIKKTQDNLFYIQPIYNGQDSGCYLNGDLITQKIQLFNLDRLTFGTNNMFIVALPDTKPRDHIDQKTIDWQFVQNQLYLKKQTLQRQIIQQRQRKIKQQTQAILKRKQQQLAQLYRNLKQSQQLRKNIQQQKQIQKSQMQKKLRQQQAQKLQRQIQKDKKKIQDSQTQQKQKIKQKYYFQKKLLKTLPKCIQLNLIAKQFKRNVSMSVKMLLPNAQGQQQDMDMKKRSIKIKVVNRQAGYVYWWDVSKLSNRYYIIKDMSEQYFDTGVIPTLAEKDDPFWDPPEHTLIGRAFLTTKALTYMFDNPVQLTIIGQDDHCGELVVNLIPTDQTGQRNLSDQMDQQAQFEPQQLIDKPFYYNLMIASARIPQNYENIYVEYSLRVDQYKTQIFKTAQIKQRTKNPMFNYMKLHNFKNLTKMLLDYLTETKLIFRIYGFQMLPQEKKQTKKLQILPDQNKAKKEDQIKIKIEKQTQTKTNQQQTIKKTVNTVNQVNQVNQVNPPQQNATSNPNKKQAVTNAVNKSANAITPPPTNKKGSQGLKKKQQKDKDKDCLIY